MELGEQHTDQIIEVVPSKENGFFVLMMPEGEFVTRSIQVWGSSVWPHRIIGGQDGLNVVFPPSDEPGNYSVHKDTRLMYRTTDGVFHSSKGPAQLVEAVPFSLD